MADRTEIDALLISALYGELTPADEARLTAHLESHPADRTALADLTHTRATVRESRILTVQLEPPQSVSALLLQEAARRAPKPERTVAGWFHRFTRSFMLHPAMAAAAMLVLVVGVAGTLYVRGSNQFAETTAPSSAVDKQIARGVAEQAPPASPAAPASVPEAAEPGRLADTANSAPADRVVAAGSAAYGVGLDDPAAQPKSAPQDDLSASRGRAKDAKNLVADGEADAAKEAQGNKQKVNALKAAIDPPSKPTAPVPEPKLAKKGASAGRGIELRSPEPSPKDFDDEQPAKKVVAKRELGYAKADAERASAPATETLAQGAGPVGGGGATAVPGMMPAQNHAAAPAPAPAVAADQGALTIASSTPPIVASNGAKSKAPAKTASRPTGVQGQAAPPPPPAAAAAAEPPSPSRDSRRQADKSAGSFADAKPAEEKTAEAQALTDWAQKQREQVLAFVKANNCRAAANAAVAIYNRAPEFYAASIATDREIKSCLPYLNSERERVDRSRAAAKRVNAADAPAQAAPLPTRK
jgi:hypothetical protein